MNSDKVCGICLQEGADMTSIFERDRDLNISISEKITQCFPEFSNFFEKNQRKICEFCQQDLDSAFRFRNNCESALLIFRCSPLPNEREEDLVETEKEETDANSPEPEFQELEHIDIDEEHLEHIDIEGTILETSYEEAIVKPPPRRRMESEMKKAKTKQRYKIRNVPSLKSLNKEKSTISPKICEICGNTYKYQHALNSHMRRHMNDRPFSCECCDKAFVSNVELRRHMRVHTGDKPYTCSYCERKFSDFGSRIKHERTHTGERPFQCQTCHKSFAYAHVLSVHLRTHTGEKKFQCTQCGKGFTKKSYMLAHIEHHKRSAMLVLKEEDEEESYDAYLQQSRTTIYGNVIKGSEPSLQPCITTYIVEEIDSENNELKAHKSIDTEDHRQLHIVGGSENILGNE